jgi:hypothetical protein
MEVLEPNLVTIPVEEQIYELIKLIKDSPNNKVEFLMGPLWRVDTVTYNEKLVSRIYHLINHHIYVVQTPGIKGKGVYLRVSGRGNVNEITKEEAIEIVGLRKGYVEDGELGNIGPNDDPEIPYLTPNCDF